MDRWCYLPLSRLSYTAVMAAYSTGMTARRHVYVRLWFNNCVFICTFVSNVYCVVSLAVRVLDTLAGGCGWLWLAVVVSVMSGISAVGRGSPALIS